MIATCCIGPVDCLIIPDMPEALRDVLQFLIQEKTCRMCFDGCRSGLKTATEDLVQKAQPEDQPQAAAPLPAVEEALGSSLSPVGRERL